MTPADTVIVLRGARGMIADRMVKSLQEAAQLTQHTTADATRLLAAKAKVGEVGVRLSVEDLLMACTVAALVRHPKINGHLTGREVRLSTAVHLGVAIALPGDLLVAPAIDDAQSKSVVELRAARRDLAERAKLNKLTVHEMTSGTFTISNLGLTRVEYFTPIIATPQIAILGIGRITEQAKRDENGSLEWRSMIGLSLTFDHRAIDGAPAAAFLDDLCNTIESGSGWE